MKKVQFSVVQQFTSGFQSLKWIWDRNQPFSSKNAKFGSFLTLFEFFCKHWKAELFWFWKVLLWYWFWKSRNLGYWQMLKFDFNILKVNIEAIAWPLLCLNRPFYRDFNGTLSVQIHPEMAEKARCQFAWSLLWPCLLRPFWPQRHLLSALYNRKESVFLLSNLF